MSKSVLVIDTPENCTVCPLLTGSDECIMQEDDANFNADSFSRLIENCPLKRLPEKKNYTAISGRSPLGAWGNGWNACIDEIAGGAEWVG